MAQPSRERFGRYEMVSKLGRGGMAETWRARLLGAAGVTKPVLIKKVLAEYANDQAFISMFISEARISATLSHGNIAQVYDFGRTEGDYFLAMEFVDGQPLHRVIKRALKSGLPGIPVPLATFIALEMCRGLHYAHTRRDESGAPLGIVHRDISPDNVLVSYEGQVKIVDFGIAKARALRGFNTEPGVVKGKYLFFSPEQARGEEVDARTDVWATGIVLYEMLCGQLPVSGQAYTAMPKLVNGEFPRPRELRPSLPAELDDIVMRALAVDREERFASCHEFGDALAGFLYSSAPRFSAMSVSYLLQELFREELTAEGREAQVPRTFLEELSLWRSKSVEEESSTLPPSRAGSGRASVKRTAEAPAEPRSKRSTVMALAAGGLLLCGVVAGVVVANQPSEAPVNAQEAQRIAMAPKSTVVPLDPSRPRPIEAPTPASAPAVAPPSKEPPPAELPPASAVFPVDSIRLDARRDLIRVSTAFAELSGLEPGEGYVLTEPDAPQDAPPVFFLLVGLPLADESVGTVSKQPVKVKGARSVMFFTVGPQDEGSPSRRTVLIHNPWTGTKATVTVHTSQAIAPLERTFELKGLDGTATYQLTLASVGTGARTRGQDGGALRKVACARQSSKEAHFGEGDPNEFLRGQQFLLTEGAFVEVRGASGLRCGFIDDDPADNQGELELRITQQGRGRGSVASAGGVASSGEAAKRAGDSGRAKQLYADGLTLFRKQQYSDADAVLAKCLAIDPSFAPCYLTRGATVARMGRMDDGARYYREFLRLAPNDDRAPMVRKLLADYDKAHR